MLNSILLQASTGNPIMQFLPIVLIVVVFYFFMIRPQMQKSKKQKEFLSKLGVGDKVITIGGAHGKISDLDEKTILVDVGNGVKIRFERSAISMDQSSMLNAENKA